MGKKAEHEINVEVNEDGTLEGYMVISHGTIKDGEDVLAKDLKWTCDVSGVELDDILMESARNICITMARIRELPEKIEKVLALDGATVKYQDIKTWTSKGSKGRKKVSEMSTDELLNVLTPSQITALLARMEK